MRRLHYHSDCPFFAGCENMLVNFFQDEPLLERYRLSFTYGYSEEYERGLAQRVSAEVPRHGVDLPDVTHFTSRIRNRALRVSVKVLGHALLAKYWLLARNTARLYRAFGSGRIDILHVNNGGYPGAYSCMAAVFAGRLRGIPRIVYVVNNIAVPYGTGHRWLDFPFDRLVARMVDVFVTASVLAETALRDVLRLPPEKLTRIPNGITPRNVTESREEYRARMGIAPARFVAASIAVLEARKGHIHLLDAMKAVPAGDTDLPLLLIEGTGPESARLMDQVRRLRIEDRVLFIGHEENIYNLLNAADLIVETSVAHTPVPNVVSEAMALGKPVVASIFSSREQITHMESGILLDPSGVEDLAAAIVLLRTDPAVGESLGAGARRAFAEGFTAAASVARYRSLYDRLLNQTPSTVK